MSSASLFRFLAPALILAIASSSLAAQLRPNIEKPGVLRVCADPDNMPLSNQKGEGYEQKIAQLIAKEWNSKVEYAWWPVRRGYFSRALNGRYCDVAMQAPAGLDMAGVTKPYFRSGYVFVTRKDSGLDLKSLADPRLKKLKIGVNLLNSDAENTPPAMALSHYGVVGNLVGFTTFYSDSARPEDIVTAVAKKDVDVAIVWGPLAGYFVKKSAVPLTLQPLPERDSLSPEFQFQYNIGLGVRRRDRALRDSLQSTLDRKGPEIQAILKQYAVPVLPVKQEGDGDDDDDKPKAAAPLPAPKDSARDSTR
ncbi:MAG TPA: quinoprotein dehydrogenase-associated putative ABC transporter substrate-binding protein [Gemmatimonadales bacterium]|nr:quinoprotein dehydrogenase-associated putative ABC transporter substrate-binding protein [Gemmatimonadales bacterium]